MGIALTLSLLVLESCSSSGTKDPTPVTAEDAPAAEYLNETKPDLTVANSTVFEAKGIFGVPTSTASMYKSPLTIPTALQPTGTYKGMPLYVLESRQQNIDLGLKDIGGATMLTSMWAYNGSVPGPLIRVKQGQPVAVQWKNSLPYVPSFLVDLRIKGASLVNKTVTHLHGADVDPANDGLPMDTINPGQSKIYTYPNGLQGTTLWYHDHAMGTTRYNVYAGLSGMYVVDDPAEAALNLPSGAYDVPLVIQDKAFLITGQLWYPTFWAPFFAGDWILTNGKAWPYQNVKPTKYRFRILNGSNQRPYDLSLSNDVPFQLISTDGGLLSSPKTLTGVPVEPGERADIIIDFSTMAGKTVTLKNAGPVDTLKGPVPPTGPTTEIMQFRVASTMTAAQSRETSAPIPNTLRPVSTFDKQVAEDRAAIKSGQLNISKVLAAHGPLRDKIEPTETAVDYSKTVDHSKMDMSQHQMPASPSSLDIKPQTILTNGILTNVSVLKDVKDYWGNVLQFKINGKGYMDSATADDVLQVGKDRYWIFANTANAGHAMHIHHIQFAVISRQLFDVAKYNATGKIVLGEMEPPKETDDSPKDTLEIGPGQVVLLRMNGSRITKAGTYVFHCHMLEHEDNDMMRPLVIQP